MNVEHPPTVVTPAPARSAGERPRPLRSTLWACAVLTFFCWSSLASAAETQHRSSADAASRMRPLGGADWPVGDARDYGYDISLLDKVIDRIGLEDGIYSVLLVRGGELVGERYFREGTRTKPHNLKSASKSIVSALVGLSIEDGRLSLDDRVVERLRVSGLKPGREQITVRHLLMMASGLESTSFAAYNAWIASSDWVYGALSRPVVAEPGERFTYSTGNTHLLSALVRNASGRSTRSFAHERLFDPLGIRVAGWETDPRGIHIGGNNIGMTPRDMAKIGELYLRGGVWRGRQIISAQWVSESTRLHIITDHEIYGDYGYHWFTPNGAFRGDFVAVGFGGQYIYVSPRFDAVVVITATLESKGREWESRVLDMIQNGLLSGGAHAMSSNGSEPSAAAADGTAWRSSGQSPDGRLSSR